MSSSIGTGEFTHHSRTSVESSDPHCESTARSWSRSTSATPSHYCSVSSSRSSWRATGVLRRSNAWGQLATWANHSTGWSSHAGRRIFPTCSIISRHASEVISMEPWQMRGDYRASHPRRRTRSRDSSSSTLSWGEFAEVTGTGIRVPAGRLAECGDHTPANQTRRPRNLSTGMPAD